MLAKRTPLVLAGEGLPTPVKINQSIQCLKSRTILDGSKEIRLCKDVNRRGDHPDIPFDFPRYQFRGRKTRWVKTDAQDAKHERGSLIKMAARGLGPLNRFQEKSQRTDGALGPPRGIRRWSSAIALQPLVAAAQAFHGGEQDY
jgi:hypothetical protein